MRRHVGWLGLLVSVGGAVGLSPVRAGAQHVVPSARAARRVGRVAIDGVLDEPAWRDADSITAFRQTQPVEGAPATQRTVVRILFDGDALYIGARMEDTGPRGVRGRIARRDQQLDMEDGTLAQLTSDKLTIMLDPYHDHLTRAVFEINPSGTKGDAFAAGTAGLDASWDPVWEAATRVDSHGWTAELRIPLSQLRFTSSDSMQTWGLQIVRTIDRLNERDAWSFSRKNESSGASRFGHLTGLELRQAARQLEIVPYVSVRAERDTAHGAPGDPVNHPQRNSATAGGDLKYLLGSNLTLDATFNPDFGQVEADPSVINLTAIETFFPEKRPFFISGASAFDFGAANCFYCSNTSNLGLFYSRRIGRQPRLGSYYESFAPYVNVPVSTTILGAAKVTGRTAGGYTVGIIDAVTSAEHATYAMATDSARHTAPVEPTSNYFVGRIKRDLGNGATTVGGMVTSAVSRLDSPILADSLHQHAEAAGVDLVTTWAQRTYSVLASVAGTNVAGTATAIAHTERSAVHYFQRPERHGFDSLATSLQGYGAYVRLAKDNGNWLWDAQLNLRSPGFETNDLSYLPRTDFLYEGANLVRQWTTPGSWYRDLSVLVGGQQQQDYEGDRWDLQGVTVVSGDFLNFWGFRSGFVRHATAMDDALTRGGPSEKRRGANEAFVAIHTDPRKPLVISVQTDASIGIDEPGRDIASTVTALVKPASNVSLSLSPSLEVSRTGQQYDTAIAAPRLTSFGGIRYVFASIDQTTLSLETRLGVAFTPTLTLDFYAQPFLASGHYSAFKQFDHPRQLHKSVYGVDVGSIRALTDGYCIDPVGQTASATHCPVNSTGSQDFVIGNPDFNTHTLHGNAVIRWEYARGSTLFLVWQQTRARYTAFGDFSLGRDEAALFRAPADNVFLVKVSYWLGR